MRAIPIFVFLAAVAACGGDNKGGFDARPADAPVTVDAPIAGPDAACFNNPTTHYEIINGCTTAQSVDKNPVLPLQLPDGGLPPLPQ